MKMDIFNVEEQVVEEAKRECERLNCSLVQIFRKSNHPDDNFTYVVIGKKKSPLWEGKEYCVWTLNTNLGGFHDGKYDVDSYNALRLCMVRIYNANEDEIDGGDFNEQ